MGSSQCLAENDGQDDEDESPHTSVDPYNV